MMNINDAIDFRKPDLYTTDSLMSSDEDILSRKTTYISPSEAAVFGHQSAVGAVSNEVLSRKSTFRLSSASAFLDMQNCYIQGELQFHLRATARGDAGLEAALGDKIAGYLERGGVHSLIQSIVVSSGSAELLRLDDYPKLYNALRTVGKTKDDLEFNDYLHLDSYFDRNCYGEASEMEDVTLVQAQTAYNAATRVLTCATSGADTDVRKLVVGDFVQVSYTPNGADPAIDIVQVDQVTANTVRFLPPGLGSGAFAANAANVLVIKRIVPKKSIRSQVIQAQADTANLVKHKFALKLPFNLFSIDRYFALPFLRAPLQVEITWNYAFRSVVAPSYFEIGHLQVGYKVSNLRFMTTLVEPSARVFGELEMMYKSGGFMYKLMGIDNVVSQLANTQNNLSFHSNKSSLKSILCVIMNRATSGSTTLDEATLRARCESEFLKDTLVSARVKNGGYSFPDYGPLEISEGKYDIEAQMELQRVFNKFGVPSSGSVVRYDKDTSDFVFGFNLAKDSSFRSGMDATKASVEMELRSGDWVAPVTLYSFLLYDQVLVLSDKGIQLHY